MSESRIIVPESLKGFLEIENCDDFPINRYYVSENQKNIIADVLRMQKITDELKNMGIPYLNTTLFYGPPGTGKTTFGRYIAYYTKQDFAYISFSKLFTGKFGEAARKVSEIFRFIASEKCVFMLDEIDCVGVKRGTEGSASGGELSNITITLMQELDYYRRHKVNSIIIGATNRVDILDEALVNRFSIKKELGPLNNLEKEEYIRMFLNDIHVEFDEQNIRTYCARTSTVRQREVEADIIRCVSEYIQNGKTAFTLSHI